MAAAAFAKRCMAEGIGTALLLATVVGSGIMGERLSGGDVGLALLANSLATGAGLSVFILVFGPVSGAHFNPVETLASALRGQLSWMQSLGYIASQVIGALIGVAVAHAMFGVPLWTLSTHARPGFPFVLSEGIAAFGLLAVILGLSVRRPGAIPYAVGAYILSAYWFTSSTSFANPAVTIARAFTDTFTGIRPDDVPGFVAGQFVGAGVAVVLFRWFDGRAGGSEGRQDVGVT